MTFGHTDRPMFVELFGLLVGLEHEWKAQGASADEINLTAFDWDYVATVNCGGNTGIRGGFKPKIVENTDDYLIQKDELGRSPGGTQRHTGVYTGHESQGHHRPQKIRRGQGEDGSG